MKVPDAIVVLASGIKKDASSWASTDLTEADNTQGSPGGTLRVRAVTILASRYPQAAVVASGGKGYDVPRNYPTNRPLLCEILGRELQDAGISADRIIFERDSNTTYQQLKALWALMEVRGWAHVAVVTNQWHVPRTRTILENKFPELEHRVTLVAAEEVLIANNREEWESSIAHAYASEWLAKRIEREERSIEQIKAGTYDFK